MKFFSILKLFFVSLTISFLTACGGGSGGTGGDSGSSETIEITPVVNYPAVSYAEIRDLANTLDKTSILLYTPENYDSDILDYVLKFGNKVIGVSEPLYNQYSTYQPDILQFNSSDGTKLIKYTLEERNYNTPREYIELIDLEDELNSLNFGFYDGEIVSIGYYYLEDINDQSSRTYAEYYPQANDESEPVSQTASTANSLSIRLNEPYQSLTPYKECDESSQELEQAINCTWNGIVDSVAAITDRGVLRITNLFDSNTIRSAVYAGDIIDRVPNISDKVTSATENIKEEFNALGVTVEGYTSKLKNLGIDKINLDNFNVDFPDIDQFDFNTDLENYDFTKLNITTVNPVVILALKKFTRKFSSYFETQQKIPVSRGFTDVSYEFIDLVNRVKKLELKNFSDNNFTREDIDRDVLETIQSIDDLETLKVKDLTSPIQIRDLICQEGGTKAEACLIVNGAGLESFVCDTSSYSFNWKKESGCEISSCDVGYKDINGVCRPENETSYAEAVEQIKSSIGETCFLFDHFLNKNIISDSNYYFDNLYGKVCVESDKNSPNGISFKYMQTYSPKTTYSPAQVDTYICNNGCYLLDGESFNYHDTNKFIDHALQAVNRMRISPYMYSNLLIIESFTEPENFSARYFWNWEYTGSTIKETNDVGNFTKISMSKRDSFVNGHFYKSEKWGSDIEYNSASNTHILNDESCYGFIYGPVAYEMASEEGDTLPPQERDSYNSALCNIAPYKNILNQDIVDYLNEKFTKVIIPEAFEDN